MPSPVVGERSIIRNLCGDPIGVGAYGVGEPPRKGFLRARHTAGHFQLREQPPPIGAPTKVNIIHRKYVVRSWLILLLI